MKIRLSPKALKCTKFLAKHKNTILAVFGAAASVTSTVLAVKATPNAMVHIEQKKAELNVDKLTVKQTVQACWKDYIYAGATGAAGLACTGVAIAGFEGAVSAATSAAAKATELYNEQSKVIEANLGQEKAAEINTQAVNNVNEHAQKSYSGDIRTPQGDQLFIDAYSKRVFITDKNWIENCLLDFNNAIVDNSPDPKMLNDFYELLAPYSDPIALSTKLGDSLGYACKDSQKETKLRIIYSDSHTVDGRPATLFSFDRPIEVHYLY